MEIKKTFSIYIKHIYIYIKHIFP